MVQQLVRFVIEQYREELITSLQGGTDENRIAEDREVVARDLLNILHRFMVSSDSWILLSNLKISVAFLSSLLQPMDLLW